MTTWNWLIVAGLLVLVYAPALNGEWIFDDQMIADDMAPAWKRGYGPGRLVSYLARRDMTHWTYFQTWRFFGLSRIAFHAGNLLLHALNGALLYSILRPYSLHVAEFATLVFLFHPLQVSAVAYVSGRAAILATLFTLAGIRGAEIGGPAFMLVPIGVYLACKSKEDGILYLMFYMMLWFLPALT